MHVDILLFFLGEKNDFEFAIVPFVGVTGTGKNTHESTSFPFLFAEIDGMKRRRRRRKNSTVITVKLSFCPRSEKLSRGELTAGKIDRISFLERHDKRKYVTAPACQKAWKGRTQEAERMKSYQQGYMSLFAMRIPIISTFQSQ